MSGATPLLDCVRRGEASDEVKLTAAQGQLAVRPYEQLALLVLLVDDSDQTIRGEAEKTLQRLPPQPLADFLARADVPETLRAFFAARGIVPSTTPASEQDAPLFDADPSDDTELAIDESAADADSGEARLGLVQQLATMSFSGRLKAAVKGSREMRAVLIRDPNKLIAVSVLSSPKVTDNEIESFSRMANVSEDVLRIIATNRTWTKNYGVTLALVKNAKTPVALTLNLMQRLTEADVKRLSADRNIPESVRLAARKRVAASLR